MYSALIVAAGSSTRMNGIDKILMPINGIPVIVRTCSVFQENKNISDIVVVASENNILKIKSLLPKDKFTKLKSVVLGGSRRQESVLNGLTEVMDSEYVLIHDGARPFVTQEIIDRGIEAMKDNDAACCGIPIVDTVKRVEDGAITATLDRSYLWRAQTPQIFRTELIIAAFSRYGNEKVTDDAMLLEKMGTKVAMFMGSKDNIKITEEYDALLGETILRLREEK